MPSFAETRAVPDLDRLRLVTEHFGSLQGLRLVVFGVFQLMLMDVWWAIEGWSYTASLIATPIMIAALIAACVYIPKYYRSRFGVVGQHAAPVGRSSHPILGRVLPASILAVVILTDCFGYGIRPKGIRVGLLVFFATWLLQSSLIHPRLAALRRVYVVPMFVLAVLLTLYPLTHSLNDLQLDRWRAINRSLIGVTLIVIGLGDHILLCRLLPKPPEDDHAH